MRDQSARDRQLRMRARMRTSHEAGVRSRRDHLYVHVRAEEAGLSNKEQHRSGLHRHVRLQRTMLGEGEPHPNHPECFMHGRCTRGTQEPRNMLAVSTSAPASGSESHHCELLHFGECLGP